MSNNPHDLVDLLRDAGQYRASAPMRMRDIALAILFGAVAGWLLARLIVGALTLILNLSRWL